MYGDHCGELVCRAERVTSGSEAHGLSQNVNKRFAPRLRLTTSSVIPLNVTHCKLKSK